MYDGEKFRLCFNLRVINIILSVHCHDKYVIFLYVIKIKYIKNLLEKSFQVIAI